MCAFAHTGPPRDTKSHALFRTEKSILPFVALLASTRMLIARKLGAIAATSLSTTGKLIMSLWLSLTMLVYYTDHGKQSQYIDRTGCRCRTRQRIGVPKPQEFQ